MKVVLSHSAAHYHPNPKLCDPRWANASASILARAAYEAASQSHQVTYVDAQRPELWPEAQCDVLISIDTNFTRANEYFRPKSTLLLAVNQHPRDRHRALSNLLAQTHLPLEALGGSDGALQSTDAVDVADRILLVGNWRTYKSYTDNGVAPHRVFATSYGFAAKEEGTGQGNGCERRDILFHLSSIGLRKGAHTLEAILELVRSRQDERRILLTGEPSNDYWATQIARLCATYQDELSYLGWIPTQDLAFDSALSTVSVGVLPTVEEGLPGTAIDLMSRGIPVLSTENSGLLLPTEWLLPDPSNAFMLAQAVLDIAREVEVDASATARTAQSLHQAFYSTTIPYQRSIRRFLESGEVWPSLNVVLPVHNKEDTIQLVLQGLTASLQDYDNSVTNVLLDGCSDGSGTEVARLADGFPGVLQMDELDDVFEVLSNNFGINKSFREVNTVMQDDNVLRDPLALREAIMLLESSSSIGCVGMLAGVNLYDAKDICPWQGEGQHYKGENEHYWRQDADSRGNFGRSYLEVDAVMRGPILFSGDAQQVVGLLDERYAPLYNDDMAWCLRARERGYRVFAIDGQVLNRSETMANPTQSQSAIYAEAYRRNSELLTAEANYPDRRMYLSLARPRVAEAPRPNRLQTLMNDKYGRVLLYRRGRERALAVLPPEVRAMLRRVKSAVFGAG